MITNEMMTILNQGFKILKRGDDVEINYELGFENQEKEKASLVDSINTDLELKIKGLQDLSDDINDLSEKLGKQRILVIESQLKPSMIWLPRSPEILKNEYESIRLQLNKDIKKLPKA